ncbi:MAG: guanylate kinase [Bacteroidia bacterium]|nr:MAG: guanylate kinase [Bacteroidia bacterium]
MEFIGKLIVFSGPSGSGKTSIVKKILEKYPDLLGFSISATTRPKRENETDGKDYYFISKEEFERKIKNNEFIEWEEVYEGIYYGTLKSEVERLHKLNKHVLFDIDVEGGLNIKKMFGNKVLTIFVMPPSLEDLRKRLELRKSESEESLKRRIGKANIEIQKAGQFDVVIVNEDLENAVQKAEEIIFKFIMKCDY